MQFITAAIFAVILTFSNIGCLSQPLQGFANPPPLCEPGIIEEMPPHIKKVCLALENSNQLSTALNAYIKNEAAALMFRGEDLANGNTGKRTDVDHVFLRFGRR